MPDVQIKKTLSAFTRSQLQTFRNIIYTLGRSGKTIEEAIEYINIITQTKMTPVGLPCPECNRNMKLFPVNSSPATQVGGDFLTQWHCPRCGHDIFSQSSFKEEINKLRRQRNGNQ